VSLLTKIDKQQKEAKCQIETLRRKVVDLPVYCIKSFLKYISIFVMDDIFERCKWTDKIK